MGKVQYSESFESFFWNIFPRKTAKLAAWKAWEKHVEGDAFLPQQIKADIEKRIRYRWFSKDKSKIPHPATWLNQRRWEDEGWEDEIKQEDKPVFTHRIPETKEPKIKLTRWQSLGNRLLFHYINASRGLSDENLEKAVAIKNDVVRRNSEPLDEEIEAGSDPKEIVMLFAELMLDNLDLTFRSSLKGKIMRARQ